MNLKEIEKEALYLSETERAILAQKLLISLDTPSKTEIEQEWLAVAQQRAKDLDEGTVQAVSAEEVRQKAMSLLR
ncbi:MAG TPA: addiction module antitoxin RelB [Sulfuricurvum sp.]|nr:addiction module antitoxin RelB [Sulfuricurvum sp.]